MRVGWIDRDRDRALGVSVYQSAGYGKAAALTVDASWEVIGDENGRWRVPLFVSPIAESGFDDAVSPYGYPGIGSDAGLSDEEITQAWEGTIDALADRGIVSVFFRFAPYRNDVDRYRELRGLEIIELSQTVIIKLSDEAEMWAAMHGRSRTAIRKAQREGLHARVSDIKPGSLPAGSGFRRVYDVAMNRVGASDAHRHDDAYYDQLIQAEDVEMRLVEVLDGQNEVVAASLLLFDEEAVHYHLSGSIFEAARNGANNLLIWAAMQWAAERGYTRFHLGGGTSKNDGLFRFKASFGGAALPFFVGRLVVDPERYDRLVRERAETLGIDPAVLRNGSFFPAYRTVAG